MRTYLKNSLFITLSLISILLIFSILISEIINEKKILDMRGFTYKNSISFSINRNQFLSEKSIDNDISEIDLNNMLDKLNEFFSYLMKKDDLVIKLVDGKLFTNGFYTNGIYFNSNYEHNYELIEGRFIEIQDFNSNDKVAVIPKTALKYVEEINDSKFIYSGNEKYKVIGVIDNGKSDQAHFNTIFYNLTPKDINYNLSLNEIIIESNIYSYEYLQEILLNNTSLILDNISSNISNKVSTLDFIKIGVIGFINLYFPLIVVIFIYLILCMYYWINRIQYEIGVKKMCGANNFSILKELIIKVLLISFISLVICPFIQNILEYSKILNRSISYTSYNFILNIIFMFTICTILTIVSFYKINKLELTKLIRRR